MAATKSNREVIKTFDFSKINLMDEEEKRALSEVISSQLKIKVEIHEVFDLLMNLATSDITVFFDQDEHGNLELVKDIKGLPLYQRQQIKEINIVNEKILGKDGQVKAYKSRIKLSLHDKQKALEHIQKHLDMWGDNKAGGTGNEKMNQFFNEVDSMIMNASKRIEEKTVDAE